MCTLRKPRRQPGSPQHLQTKHSHWEDFAAFLKDAAPGVEHLHDVTREHAEAYVGLLRSEGPYGKRDLGGTASKRSTGSAGKKKAYCRQISNRTANIYLVNLRQIFALLAEDASVEENPFEKIPKLENDSEEREPFTPEELALIGQEADEFLFPIFLFGVNTGLREGDICTLKWSEVDLQRGWINRRTSKTRQAVRIPILPSLHSYLSGLPRTCEHVLPEQARVYRESRTLISYRVKRFLGTIGIDNTRAVAGRDRQVSVKDIHSLRHTWAYMAAIHDVPFPVVQAVLGHGSPRISRIYTDHATDKVKRETLLRLPDYLTGRDEPTPKQKAIDLVKSLTAENLPAKKPGLLSLLSQL